MPSTAGQRATACGATWYALGELFDDRPDRERLQVHVRGISLPAAPATGKPVQQTLRAVPAGKAVWVTCGPGGS
ncbi:hypothetical protein OG291_03225 [Streptomyces halstedii]|uniref:hypothetical protein n=1 Tax=Streptomyces halstedii TaxID=1944 RepID=UPI00386B0EBC|nr:hypothetical protein OG291_03225 [Streptomyces halstedii]